MDNFSYTSIKQRFDLILVLNVTFSNISAISWRPALVVEEAGVSGENHLEDILFLLYYLCLSLVFHSFLNGARVAQ
jgi:hypothetical protein